MNVRADRDIVLWLALAHVLCASVASAQSTPEPESFLVIPSLVGSAGDPSHVARRTSLAIDSALESRDVRVRTPEQAKQAFEQRGSSQALIANTSDIDALARDAQQALYHVASGLYSRAKQDVQRAMDRARGALESLNRENRAARHLLDACMYLVRGHLDRHERENARRQALECRRLVPDIEPDSTMHPPDVIGVLAEAEAELLAREPSSLRVESDPQGCALLLNGRNLGSTPKELSRLSPGEYRVQVECHEGEPGRVHRAQLSNSRIVIRVDTRFDRVVQSVFDLSLRYASVEEETRYRTRDILEAARTVGVTDVVSVWNDRAEDGTPRVAAERVRTEDGKLLASARAQLNPDGQLSAAALTHIVDTLLAANTNVAAQPSAASSAALAPAAVVASNTAATATNPAAPSGAQSQAHLLSSDAATDPQRDRDDTTLPIIGYALGGTGVAASIAGWITYADLASQQSDYAAQLDRMDPARFDSFRKTEDYAQVPIALAATGATLTTASLPLWLPDTRGVPWWAWASGGAGLIVATIGTKLTLDASDCLVDELGRCVDPALATRLGPDLILQSLPLIAVPIVYGLRALVAPGAAPSAQQQVDLSFSIGEASAHVTWKQSL